MVIIVAKTDALTLAQTLHENAMASPSTTSCNTPKVADSLFSGNGSDLTEARITVQIALRRRFRVCRDGEG